jgi:hypothetical protein
MQTEITLQALLQCGAIIMALFGSYKVIMEIVRTITDRHDKEQAWNKAVKDIEVDRESLKKEFNERLDEQDAKIQQLVSMICMTLKAQDAILEALVDRDIGNGEIKAMHRELKDFIMKQVS